jgi:Protein of unknown function (DUF3455)
MSPLGKKLKQGDHARISPSVTKREKSGIWMRPWPLEAEVRKLAYCTVAGILLVSAGFAVGADEPTVLPPQGSTLLLKVIADGVQIYACEAKDNGFKWMFEGPEASLFDEHGRQEGTHFGGPTWKLDDGSLVVGKVVAKADAPEPGAIPWLLLRATSHEGSGRLSTVAFIQRANTKGGAAPAAGCDASHLPEQARMRYSAEYQFFSIAK